MPPKKTAFLFIPGAWCPAYFFHKVTEKLQAQGYTAQALDLPSIGKKATTPGLQDDIAYVRSAATALLDAGKDLVIVGNSYGGFVTLESAKTLVKSARDHVVGGGELKHLILISSFCAEVGDTMKALATDAPLPASPGEDPWIEPVPGEMNYRFLCGSLSEEEGLRYGNMVRAQCVRPMFEPLTFAAYEVVETTVVVGGRDCALRPEVQEKSFRSAVERGVEGLRLVVLAEGDHCLMLGLPDEVVGVCVGVGGV
ncbi:alpha/beta-hydrolase [Massarina eburnea CBS 473.64]|uniref:Alpha/beta-hydrolase n=1 Tax=Massarina eburnea CBS 473.64 TaxID=1395130 RepID=A0A6A6S4V3_9PLEO|nr:alpha/beta-hydrolase [Massarina eburnea CBS 473.64]